MENISWMFQKKKEKRHKEMNVECRKVLEKMPADIFRVSRERLKTRLSPLSNSKNTI